MNLKAKLLALFATVPFMASAQINVTDAEISSAYTLKTITRQGNLCHDPSIIVDTISSSVLATYYIYGSHLGHGKTSASKNYQQWETWGDYEAFGGDASATATTKSLFKDINGNYVSYANAYNTHAVTKVTDVNGNEVDFGNFNAHEWQYTGDQISGNQWAADVIYNKTMKKWCMYMSINAHNWCSVIVCLTSSSPKGPWVYQGPVVFSGFGGGFTHNGFSATNDYKHTDLEIALGSLSSLPARYDIKSKGYNYGNYWPNCIDPCVFYDENGDIWMSYGSWSSGIYVLKLNPANGLRDYTYKYDYIINNSKITPGNPNQACNSDPYFGKRIAGGYYSSGEASYIEKIGDKYFLFMSYGGLETTGGYQMRVFRSDSPLGPFKDPYGTSAIYTGYRLNYGAGATDARGMLLMGGYKWPLMPYAEIAQGHNSAFTDKEGRSFVVYHTRSTIGHEGHEVRVHQLFLNEDGWIMASPFEFSGEKITNKNIASAESIDNSEIPGNYQFMRHKYNQDTKNLAYQTPVNIELTADGKITGGATGTWTRKAGTDFINLNISGVVYKGVLVRQTIDYSNIKAVCIAACSSSSGSLTIGQNTFTYQQNIWAVKADAKAAIAYTYNQNKYAVTLSNGAVVNKSITLPTAGHFAAKVLWESSDPSIMSNAGVVNGSGDVVMTMKIQKDGYEYKKSYSINVNPSLTTPVYYPESTSKNTTSSWWVNFSKSDYVIKKGETMKFKFYNYSSATVNNHENWCLYGASTTHGASGFTEYFGVRNDNWDNTSASNTGCTSDFNWSTFIADMKGSLVDMEVQYTSAGTFTMKSTITTTSNKVYNYSYTKTISSSPAQLTLFFVSEKSYIDGSSLVTGINDLPASLERTHDALFNMSGQRVSNSYRGIVIKNGKKYMKR